MARQGKMHSSPFHVETVNYKEAIEHFDYEAASTDHCVYCKNDFKCQNVNSDYYTQQCQYFKCKSSVQRIIPDAFSSYPGKIYDPLTPQKKVVYCYPDTAKVQYDPRHVTKSTERIVSLINAYIECVEQGMPEDKVAFKLRAIKEEVNATNESLEALALANMSHAMDTIYHGKYKFETKKYDTDRVYAKLTYDPGVLNNLAVFFSEHQISSLIEQYKLYGEEHRNGLPFTVSKLKLKKLTQEIVNIAYRAHGEWKGKKPIFILSKDVTEILYLYGVSPFYIKQVNVSRTDFMDLLSRIIMKNYVREP